MMHYLKTQTILASTAPTHVSSQPLYVGACLANDGSSILKQNKQLSSEPTEFQAHFKKDKMGKMPNKFNNITIFENHNDTVIQKQSLTIEYITNSK